MYVHTLDTYILHTYLHLQATEAENKEDREIVCEEVFCDITGRLDDAARGEHAAGHAATSAVHTLFCFVQEESPLVTLTDLQAAGVSSS